jgi:hypothetical protein
MRKQGKAPIRRECNHLDMMHHPERWQTLVLPLKHRSRMDPCGLRLLGFMFEDELKPQAFPKVYVGSIFFRTLGQRIEDLPIEHYASLDAVVAAGWEVD